MQFLIFFAGNKIESKNRLGYLNLNEMFYLFLSYHLKVTRSIENEKYF